MKFSMKKVTVLLADGFEEIEALTVVDLLRRAKVYVDTVSITDDYTVRGAHGIPVQTEDLITEIDFKESDMIVLPGGMPGTTNLKEDENVRKAVQEAYDDGRYVAAICAAPTILADMGLLKVAILMPAVPLILGVVLIGMNMPNVKREDAYLTGAPVATDENIITSQGVGTAIDFALKLIEVLISEEKAVEIADSIVYQR